MRKAIISLICCSIFSAGIFIIQQPINVVTAQNTNPSYAKWGRLAMQKVHEKYPNANIVDYFHVGRKKGAETSTETFKLWLEAPDKEFGIFIDITFTNDTEEVVDIGFREVSS
ncbi:DUF3889 domain-containing protein [Ornithinibacillus scapharcae]|uniref:DUF3889 domain-containing protein n=1 Tax=Ornithinibacillus scapharcae TaxID=1147159 RepID=UPI000225C0F0|nr:DUF3889 domain-containing protein [Ornithinibacillus scapharcae]